MTATDLKAATRQAVRDHLAARSDVNAIALKIATDQAYEMFVQRNALQREIWFWRVTFLGICLASGAVLAIWGVPYA